MRDMFFLAFLRSGTKLLYLTGDMMKPLLDVEKVAFGST